MYSNCNVYLHKNPPICITYEMRQKMHYGNDNAIAQRCSFARQNRFLPSLKKD
jgi:hypothetical protein